MKLVDLNGQRFGRLVIVERVASRDGKAYWLCRCDCGNTRETASTDLRSKRRPITSCGCARRIQYQPGEVACQVATPRFPQGRTGTFAGYRAHVTAGQEPCPECVEGNRAAARARHAALPADVKERRRPAARLAEARYKEKALREGQALAELACTRPTERYPTGRTGTVAGAGAHQLAGQPLCPPCREARNADRRVPEIDVLLPGLPICYYPTHAHPSGRVGTVAGYQAHLRIGEKPCKRCYETTLVKGREAWANLTERERERRREANRAESARYRENSPVKARAAKHRYIRTNREIMQAAKSVPCMDCKVSYPTYVMQFDHRPGTKKLFTIALTGPQTSRERLYAEIEKCDVVCANCHFERTQQRRRYHDD